MWCRQHPYSKGILNSKELLAGIPTYVGIQQLATVLSKP